MIELTLDTMFCRFYHHLFEVRHVCRLSNRTVMAGNCWYAVVAKNPYRVTATPHTTPLCSIANSKCAYTQLAGLCNS